MNISWCMARVFSAFIMHGREAYSYSYSLGLNAVQDVAVHVHMGH